MNKIYLCGITSNEIEKITDLINQCSHFFDGLVWCVDSAANDGTYEFLEQNKKSGQIIQHKWGNHHGHQMNEFLLANVMRPNDWYFICDSSEIPTETFLSTIRDNLENWEQNNVGAIYASGRPYFIKYHDHQNISGTPHWWLEGIVGNVISIKDEDKDKFILNKRNLNPGKHYQEHDTKYWFVYGISNQVQAMYGKFGRQTVEYHEFLRLEFRNWFRQNVNSELSLKNLENFLEAGVFNDYVKGLIEIEFCLSEFYQNKILKMDFMSEIVPQRYQWSFKHFLRTGQKNQLENGYKGTIIHYNDKLAIEK